MKQMSSEAEKRRQKELAEQKGQLKPIICLMDIIGSLSLIASNFRHLIGQSVANSNIFYIWLVIL